MRPLQIALFLIAVLVLTTQAVRHVSVRFIEPRTSVLDQYEDTDAKKAIRRAEALSDLVSQYDVAKKRVDELDKEKKQALANKTKDEYDMLGDKWMEDHKEEYERETDLKAAIQQWERQSNEIRELRVFWLFGLAFFVAGALMFARGLKWIGTAFIIPGVVEMTWWTSPTIRFYGSDVEFDRLLTNKLVFTLVTLLLLIVAWCVNDRRRRYLEQTNR